MKRSEFLRQLGLVTGGVAFGLDGVSGRAFAHNPFMLDLAGTNGSILVLVQLQGGNDGFNTVVPFEDAAYYQKRAIVNIKKAEVLPITDTLGLHPSLAGFKRLYDEDKLCVVNNVGYPSPNRSHFRSTDIWLSGSDASQYLTDGWVGRYLTSVYSDYPAKLPEQPMAIQLGSVESLLMLSQVGTTATVFNDPNEFYQLVSGSTADNDPPPATMAGDELKFLKQIAAQSIQYSGVIKEKADKGKNTLTYPNTNLGRQLGIVAKLISGGGTTPVYLTTIGGFDTHANQLTQHANLLKQVSDAVLAFQSDLEKQNIAEKVTLMTFSEFGRRLPQNGTSGTDHGTAAPLFVIGKTVRGGTLGGNPNLTDLDSSGDIKFKNDFRQVYTSILRDHLGMSDPDAKAVLSGKDFAKLPIFRTSIEAPAAGTLFGLAQNFPNPASGLTKIRYEVYKPQTIRLSLFDLQGQELAVLKDGLTDVGAYTATLDASSLPAGFYLYSMQGEGARQTKRMVVQR
ncbi:MAG: DUF1501 domain-containing protein [Cytophagaceae bacterium]|nr:DUF1501 domain-containing protein [Cytophagaceae bacterium]